MSPIIGVCRYFRDQLWRTVRLGVLSLLSAQCQAAALVLIVPLAKAISAGEHTYHGKFGPVHISVSTTTLAALAAGAIVIAAILDTATAWFRSVMIADWEFRRRELVVDEYLAADYPIQAAERLGTLGTLSTYVSRGATVLAAATTALGAVLTMAVFVAVALFLSPAALALIVIVGALGVVLRPVMRKTKRYSRALATQLVEYNADVTETTRMARDVRIFDGRSAIGRQLRRTSRRIERLRQRALFAQGVTSPVYQYLGLLLVVCALAAASGIKSLDVAEFGAIALLLLRTLSSGQQLANSYQMIVDAVPYLDKLEEMRAVYREHTTPDGTVHLEDVHTLQLADVRYSYDGQGDAVAGVSSSFVVGEIVGIVGPSGSGKSTLSQLLLRLREPTDGEIFVNRIPARTFTLTSWYRNIALVPQDPRLLHATVAENIAFLDATIPMEHIVLAAKAAGVHDVIQSLEHGYDTMVGPAFRDLSGGQIQRIGIARALARGARVLVLDEPTSALDVHSESVIQNTLSHLRNTVLVIIIAHRLSTLSICDRVIVMRDGRIETAGSLTDVSERSYFFRRALEAGTLEIGDRSVDLEPGVSDEPELA